MKHPDLLNPPENEAPLVALVRTPMHEMNDTEVGEILANLRALRTNAASRTSKLKTSQARKPKTEKLQFNPNDLFG
jgi:ATP-dependent exoDNAse (exonuclease V) beta subunit